MANFQAVGTRAVVEGYDSFISQIQGMDRQVQSLGASLGKLPEPLRAFNTASTAMSKNMAKIGSSVNTLSGANLQSVVTNLGQATSAMAAFVNTLGGTQTAARAMSVGLRTLAGATQRFTTTKKDSAGVEQQNIGLFNQLSAAGQNLASRFSALVTAVKGAVAVLKLMGAAASIALRGIAALGSVLHAVTFGVLKRFGDEIKRVGNNLIGMGRNIQMFGRNLMFLVSLPIAAALGGMVKAAIDFESAMAGVFKTVTLSDTAITNLSLGIREMSLRVPLAAAELAGLAEIGGQLGIDTFGGDAVQNLLAFTETIAAIGVSTNLAKEEAAEGFAQIIAIMGDAEVDFVSQIESLGSSIVNLGNNFSTTEARILSFSLKIAGVANAVGLTIDEVLGISTAFTSAGVAAERGGTAVQTTLITIDQAVSQMGDHLQIVARVSGLTADQFAVGWTKGMINIKGQILTTGDLFARFVEGLGQQADGGIDVLESLGLGNARLLQSFLSVGGAQGRMTSALKVARQGYTETGVVIDQYGNRLKGLNALETEAARRYATTASQITLFKNSVADLGITIGEFVLPVLNQLTVVGRAVIDMIKQADERWLKLGVAVGLFAAVIGPTVVAMGLFITSLGSIMAVIGTVLAGIGSLVSLTGLLVAPFIAAGIAVVGLAIAFAAAFDDIMAITDTSMSELSADLYSWGHELVITFAEGMLSAITAVINALITIGNVIASWLSPGSPPRLLPELDDWGAGAMEAWMSGWGEADFDIFNDISGLVENWLRSLPTDIMPEEGLIPAIMGSRTGIAEIIEMINQTGQVSSEMIDQLVAGWGPAGQAVASYVLTLAHLEQANEEVRRAQEALNNTTKKYRDILKPINRELDEINDIRQATVDAMRIEELNAMIADPNASAQVKELARLELRKIELEQQKDTVEEQQAIEEEQAQERLDAAKAQQDALEAQAAAQKAQIDAMIENNRLLQEHLRLLERLDEEGGGRAKKGPEAPEPLDLSGISPFDPSGLEDPFENIGQAMADRVTLIKKQFSQLLDDLSNLPAWQNLKAAWDKLGEVWAPVFINGVKVIDQIVDHLKNLTTANFEKAVNAWVDKIKQGDWAGAGKVIIDLLLPDGLIQKKLTDSLTQLDTTLQTKGQELGKMLGEGIQAGLQLIFGNLVGGNFLASLILQVQGFGAAFDTIKESWDTNIAPLLDDMGEKFSGLAQTIDLTGILNVLKGVYTGFVTVVTGIVLIATGLITGLITGAMKVVSVMAQVGGSISSGIATLWNSIKLIGSGIVNTLQGIVDFFKGGIILILGMLHALEGALTGNAETINQGLEVIGVGLDTVRDGFDQFVLGFGQLIQGIVEGVISFAQVVLSTWLAPFAAIGAFLVGWVEGVIAFFQNLYDRLVGHSIVVDLVTRIQSLFTDMAAAVLATVSGWVASVIQFFVDLYVAAETKFTELKTLLETKWGEIKTGIATITGEILTAIGEWADNVIADLKDPFERFLTETLPGLITNFYDSGVNIMAGVIDGILSQADALIAALLGPLEDAWNAATNWLDEHSPSGRYEISGKNIIQGYIVGIESQSGALQRTLVNTLQSAAPSSISQGTVTGPTTGYRQPPPPTYLPAAARATNVNNSRSVSMNFGDTNVRNDGDINRLVFAIRQVLRDEMRNQI